MLSRYAPMRFPSLLRLCGPGDIFLHADTSFNQSLNHLARIFTQAIESQTIKNQDYKKGQQTDGCREAYHA